MSIKKFKNALLLFAVVVFLPAANTAFAGLGISPSQIIAPNLSKGAHMEKTFVLSRSDPDEDLYFKVSMEGATKDWTTLDKGVEFVMPKGEQRFSIAVVVDVPKDAANGEYKGGIRLASSLKSPENTAGSGASTSLSALIQTDLTVTGEEVLEYEITSTRIQNTEEGFPLGLLLSIINTGNVTARPTKVHVEVLDKFNVEVLDQQDITEMGSVEPFTTGDIVIPVPTKLKTDQYWAKVSAYRDETVLKEQNMVFEIVEVGSLQKNGNLKELLYNKEAAVGETVKITGVFENAGQTSYSAKLVAEIFKNSKLFKLIESEPASVETGKTENLSAYFTPDEPAEYSAKAYVSYSGKKTPEMEAKIAVGIVGSSGLTPSVTLLVLIVVVIVLAVYFKKRKQLKEKQL